MNANLNSLQEIVFSVREKLSDNEYLSMMENLNALFRDCEKMEESKKGEARRVEIERFFENISRRRLAVFRDLRRMAEEADSFPLPDLFERCPCSNERWKLNSPCHESLDGFLKCDYLRDFLDEFPLTHFILSEKELVCPKFRYSRRPVLNFEKKLGAYDKKQVCCVISIFTKFLIPEIIDKKYKLCLALDFFSFLFSNYKFLDDNQKVKKIFMEKIIQFRSNFEPSNLLTENLFLLYEVED